MKKTRRHKTLPSGLQANHPEGAAVSLDPRHVARWLAYGVAFLTLFVYGIALFNGFVNLDDDLYVYGNLHIQSLKPAFFTWAFTDLSAGFWHPLTWITYAVDYAIWGMNPMGYHLTAIMLHALNTWLVVRLIIKLLEFRSGAKAASWLKPFPEGWGVFIAAGVTGLLFGLHPLHVESVAWVSERKDLLCALFFLLSVTAYVDFVRQSAESVPQQCVQPFWRKRMYLLSLGMFVCALASKTMAVSLPLVLLILDRFQFGRIRSLKDLTSVFVEKIPFVIPSLLISVVSITAQHSIGALPLMASTSLGPRLLVAFHSIAAYLEKMLIPLDLMPVYPYPQDVRLLDPVYAVPLLLFFVVSVVAVRVTPSWRALPPAWLYYLITLLPVLGIVQVGTYAMADRFTYLPSLGPFLLTGLAAAWGWDKIKNRAGKNSVVSVVILLVISISVLTLKQIAVWKSSIDLWNYVIKKDPRRIQTAYLNRGVAYGDRREFDRAIADFTTVLSYDPRSVDAFLNRGMAHVARLEYDKAIADYDAALTVRPDFADAYTNRGSVFLRKKDFDRAIIDYDRAIALQPGLSAAYLNRALAHQEKGAVDLAIKDYDEALKGNLNFVNAYLKRGDLHMKKGDVERAVADYQNACKLGSNLGCRKALMPLSLQ
jgi:Tfp pilus assembly protein PilF